MGRGEIGEEEAEAKPTGLTGKRNKSKRLSEDESVNTSDQMPPASEEPAPAKKSKKKKKKPKPLSEKENPKTSENATDEPPPAELKREDQQSFHPSEDTAPVSESKDKKKSS